MKGVQVTSRGDGLARGTRARIHGEALTFAADGNCQPVIRVAPDLLYLADLRLRRVQYTYNLH